jgi:hypothetical protein
MIFLSNDIRQEAVEPGLECLYNSEVAFVFLISILISRWLTETQFNSGLCNCENSDLPPINLILLCAE